MSRLRRAVLPITSRLPILGAITLARTIDDGGWIRSRRGGQPVDGKGDPVPWLPYIVTDLLARVPHDAAVLEWGSGSSTRWWAKRVTTVVAIEHDAAWHAEVAGGLTSGATVTLASGDDYVKPPAGPFDVILIDGVRRNECAKNAPLVLTERGVIVWDNSGRERYQAGLDAIGAIGFRRLDLLGVVPGEVVPQQSTIFYRDGNCLGI